MVNASQDAFGLLAPRQEEIIGPLLRLDTLSQLAQALEYLRSSEDAIEDEFMYYVYILDSEERLKGVVSLRDLVTAPLDKPLSNWFDEEAIKVNPLTPQDECAYLVAKYDLMAIPVVDPESNVMLGIVTVDDAIDTVLPTAWKKKLPRFSGR